MTTFLLVVLFVLSVIVAVGLLGLWLGTTLFDRLIAVALVTINAVVILVVMGFLFDRPVLFLDIALGVALLAFILPIALGKYVERSPEHEDLPR